MKKNTLFFALALLMFVACGKSEKNTEQSEKPKTETTEKSAEKENATKSDEKIDYSKYLPETQQMLALHSSNFKPKMKDKDIMDLLQGNWDLSAEIDPGGEKTKPKIAQKLIVKGENAKITCMNCENNSHKLVDALVVLTQKMIRDENILQGLILEVRSDLKDGDGKLTTIAMPYGISKITKEELILEYIGGEGGKAIYKRAK